jgi:S-adenosylmethionine:tRNA ribosyltransferase-isomerase
MVKEIRIEDFDYNLPDERIPRHPLQQRDACRLLLFRPDGVVAHRRFSELPDLLPPGATLVCNDTRVINARMTFFKTTGSRIEVFLLEPLDPADYVLTFQTRGRCVWSCLVGNLKRWKEGTLSLTVTPRDAGKELPPVTLTARRLHPTGGNAHAIEFTWDNPDVTFASVVEGAGFIPIPPYLKRESEQCDATDYQTVYADVKGSVAAPTAGLHFTPEVFENLAAHNVEVGKLTLHVGAGTFQPVKSEQIGEHPMHTETFSVSRELLQRLVECKRTNSPLVAVGTTSVRTLESLPYIGAALLAGDESMHVGQWVAYAGNDFDTVEALEAICRWLDSHGRESLTASTAIMIAPGFEWRMADVLVTNFHQPQSTLLLLVSSFLGDREPSETQDTVWRRIYAEAMANDYRFLSYGDACLLFRPSTFNH